MTVDGKTLSTHFFISNLGKEDVILGLLWLKFMNPEVDWTKKTLRVIKNQVKLPSIKRCILNEFEVRVVEIVQEKGNSQQYFAKETQNLPKERKDSRVMIEEITDEEATPKHPRILDTERSILIAANSAWANGCLQRRISEMDIRKDSQKIRNRAHAHLIPMCFQLRYGNTMCE